MCGTSLGQPKQTNTIAQNGVQVSAIYNATFGSFPNLSLSFPIYKGRKRPSSISWGYQSLVLIALWPHGCFLCEGSFPSLPSSATRPSLPRLSWPVTPTSITGLLQAHGPYCQRRLTGALSPLAPVLSVYVVGRTEATLLSRSQLGSQYSKHLLWFFNVPDSVIGAGHSTENKTGSVLDFPWFYFSSTSTWIDTCSQTISMLASRKKGWGVWDSPSIRHLRKGKGKETGIPWHMTRM